MQTQKFSRGDRSKLKREEKKKEGRKERKKERKNGVLEIYVYVEREKGICLRITKADRWKKLFAL